MYMSISQFPPLVHLYCAFFVILRRKKPDNGDDHRQKQNKSDLMSTLVFIKKQITSQKEKKIRESSQVFKLTRLTYNELKLNGS